MSCNNKGKGHKMNIKLLFNRHFYVKQGKSNHYVDIEFPRVKGTNITFGRYRQLFLVCDKFSERVKNILKTFLKDFFICFTVFFVENFLTLHDTEMINREHCIMLLK